MANKTTIEWTDTTWNPVTGCTKISAGCDNCYAERFSERFRGTPGHAFESGFDLMLRPERVDQPFHWRKPRMVFVNSMSDLFHKDIPDAYISRVCDTMEQAKWHTFQVLTKRSSLMRNFLKSRYGEGSGPTHIWFGVSVEDGGKLSRIRQSAHIEHFNADVAKASVADRLKACDYIFLAADSMRARLVVNALVHQYLIPAVQLGSKVRADEQGQVIDAFSAIRPLRPGAGCLWCNQLIDPNLLAKEAKTDAERKAQAYGVEEPNPSVISLNAVSAGHAVNDFLMDYLGLRADRQLHYQHINALTGKLQLVEPRQDADCPECSKGGTRFARGDGADLPCTEG